MTLQLVLQNHRLHPVVNQILRVLANLTIKPWVLQRCPCLRDRPLLSAQPWERCSDPQRSNPISRRPGGFQFAQFGFGGHGWQSVACCDLGMPSPAHGKAFQQ